MGHRVGIILAVSAWSAAGCTAPHGPRTVTNPDVIQKIPAMSDAVRRHDVSVIPHLVNDLDSEDPAIRFYSIDALRKLTGEDFGYHYWDEADRRRPPIRRWQEWLRARK